MIELRDIIKDDAEQMLRWRNLPDVSQYMYTDHIITYEEHSAWLDRVLNSDKTHYWIIQLDDEPVGVANVTDINWTHSTCFWAFYLASPNVRGRGVGSYVEYFVLNHVFNTLALNKLCCEVISFNQAVIDMHKSFGFKQEGFFYQHIRKSEKFYDVVRLAMLRSEWQEIQPAIEQKLRNKGLIA